MRKLLLILIILPLFSMAQKEPAKRDNLIIIKGCTLNQDDIITLLYQKDYEVDVKSKGMIITKYKPVNGLDNVKMKLTISDTAIVIKSYYKLSTKILGSNMENSIADWRGSQSGTPKTVFKAAIKFAENLKGQMSFAKDSN